MSVMEPAVFTVERADGTSLTLRGTRYLPEGFSEDGHSPVAVLFHGFGGNRIDFSGFVVQMARELASRGLVVVTYDRAGHGESDGTFFDTTVSGDVEDALQVVEQARHMSGCDPDNLHFAGLSLGAVICTLLAPKVPGQPKSIALCSTATSYVDEIAGGHIQGKPLSAIEEQGYLDFMGVAMGPAMVEDAGRTDPYGMACGPVICRKVFRKTDIRRWRCFFMASGAIASTFPDLSCKWRENLLLVVSWSLLTIVLVMAKVMVLSSIPPLVAMSKTPCR